MTSLLHQPELDICSRRHSGNSESVASFRRVTHSLPAARSKVLAEIDRAGSRGLTAKEYAAATGVQLNTISGRFSELKKAGQILKTGVRDHSAVYVSVKQSKAA